MPTPTTRTRFAKSWTGFAKGKKSIGQFLQTDKKLKYKLQYINYLRYSLGVSPNSLTKALEK
jgi:hypothetical protein